MCKTDCVGTAGTSTRTTVLEVEAKKTAAKTSAQETNSVNCAKNKSLMIVFSSSILRP